MRGLAQPLPLAWEELNASLMNLEKVQTGTVLRFITQSTADIAAILGHASCEHCLLEKETMLKGENFKAGQLSTNIRNRKTLTKDQNILDIIKGDSIDFTEKPSYQNFARNPSFSNGEAKLIEKETDKMIEKGIIRETYHKSNEFVSPIFIKHKQDGGTRLILNLKKLNKYVKYEQFKMDNIKSV